VVTRRTASRVAPNGVVPLSSRLMRWPRSLSGAMDPLRLYGRVAGFWWPMDRLRSAPNGTCGEGRAAPAARVKPLRAADHEETSARTQPSGPEAFLEFSSAALPASADRLRVMCSLVFATAPLAIS